MLRYAGAGRCDRGCCEELAENARCAQAADPDGSGTLRPRNRQPRRYRRERRCTRDHGGAACTSAGGDGSGACRGTAGAAGRSRPGRRYGAGAAYAAGARRSARGEDAGAAYTAGGGRARGRHRAGAGAVERPGGQDRGLQLAGQRDRQYERERSALMPNLLLEVCAGRAAVDVCAQHGAGEDPGLRRCQTLADLGAWALPRAPSAHQRFARLKHKRLHLLLAHTQHISDFLLRVISELEKNERSTLIVGEPPHILQQLAKVLSPLDQVCHPVGNWSIHRHRFDVDDLAASAQLGEAAITSDGVKPRSQGNVALAAAYRPERRDERDLERVLGCLAASQHVHAEREHSPGVSLVDSLKGGVVAGAQPSHKALVAFARASSAIEPTAEPGNCRVGPHGHSVRHGGA